MGVAVFVLLCFEILRFHFVTLRMTNFWPALSVRVEYVRFDDIALTDSTPENFVLVKK